MGSPLGDDQVGWRTLRALETVIQSTTVVFSQCHMPAAELLGLMRDGQRVILIDGIHSGLPLGHIHCWRDQAVLQMQGSLSTHGVDVASLLALAAALQQLPPEIIVYGIEIDKNNCTPESHLSLAVEQAIPQLVHQIKAFIDPSDLRARS